VQELLGPQTSFAEVAEAMGSLIKAGKILTLATSSPNPTITPTPNQAGKIRGWGMCNDNAYGLAASVYTSRALGVPAPCVLLLLYYYYY